MRISRFNHEGYYDPTTYRAFKNIDKDEKRKARFRPIVYICSRMLAAIRKRTLPMPSVIAVSPLTAVSSRLLRICTFRSSWMTVIAAITTLQRL